MAKAPTKCKAYVLLFVLFTTLTIITLHLHLQQQNDIHNNIMYDFKSNNSYLINQLKSNIQQLHSQYDTVIKQLSQSNQQIKVLQQLILLQNQTIQKYETSTNQKHLNSKSNTIKIIWILWFQGWQNAPMIPQMVLKSWKYFNKDWIIIPLSDNNLKFYVHNYTYWRNFVYIKYSWAGLSDIIRLELLNQYGGIWVDATVFCTKPLNEWIFDCINENGFFAFDHPRKNTQISSWFLTSLYWNKSYIMNTWYQHLHIYWKQHKHIDTYFWLHGIFDELYDNNNEFKEQYDAVYKWSADGPHTLKLASSGNHPINKKVIKEIDKKRQPMFKLIKSIEWNWSESDSIWRSNLGYLIKTYIFINDTIIDLN
eukprot:540201_1